MSTPRPTTAPAMNPALPWAAFAVCAAVWGSTFVVISVGNDTVAPMWAATIRLVLAAVLLTAVALVTGQGLPRGRALQAALGFGALNFGFNFCLLYWGETKVPSGIAAVIFGTIPFTATLFARMMGLEKLGAAKLFGTLVAFAGVVVLFAGRVEGQIPLVPMLAVLLAATLASLSGVVLKAGPRQPPIGANAAAAWIGAAICGTGSFVAGESHVIPATFAAWFPILYLTVAGSFVAFVTYAWLVNQWPVTRISFVAVIVPVVALILGSTLRGEPIGPAVLLGTGLVIGGLFLGIMGSRGAAH
jgi:drug/metabolite transporter (DMT)-like permease